MEHNQRLWTLLRDIKSQAKQAEDEEGLLIAIRQAKAFDGPLAYDNKPLLICFSCGLTAALALLIAYGAYTARNPALTSTQWVGFCILGCVVALAVLVPVVLYFSRQSSFDSLSDLIFERNILHDNGLTEKAVPTDMLSALQREYREFNRGNHSRSIERLICGSCRGEPHSFDFDVVHFHYVDSRTETTVVSDGKGGTSTQTRTVYDHYDRYSLLLPFLYARSLAVASVPCDYPGITWKPASVQFNKQFKVYAESEHAAALFLVPSVVLTFIDVAKHFSGLNFEVSAQQQLCVSFRDDDLLALKRQFGIESPVEFEQEVEGKLSPVKFERIQAFIQKVMTFTDNNFDEE